MTADWKCTGSNIDWWMDTVQDVCPVDGMLLCRQAVVGDVVVGHLLGGVAASALESVSVTIDNDSSSLLLRHTVANSMVQNLSQLNVSNPYTTPCLPAIDAQHKSSNGPSNKLKRKRQRAVYQRRVRTFHSQSPKQASLSVPWALHVDLTAASTLGAISVACSRLADLPARPLSSLRCAQLAYEQLRSSVAASGGHASIVPVAIELRRSDTTTRELRQAVQDLQSGLPPAPVNRCRLRPKGGDDTTHQMLSNTVAAPEVFALKVFLPDAQVNQFAGHLLLFLADARKLNGPPLSDCDDVQANPHCSSTLRNAQPASTIAAARRRSTTLAVEAVTGPGVESVVQATARAAGRSDQSHRCRLPQLCPVCRWNQVTTPKSLKRAYRSSTKAMKRLDWASPRLRAALQHEWEQTETPRLMPAARPSGPMGVSTKHSAAWRLAPGIRAAPQPACSSYRATHTCIVEPTTQTASRVPLTNEKTRVRGDDVQQGVISRSDDSDPHTARRLLGTEAAVDATLLDIITMLLVTKRMLREWCITSHCDHANIVKPSAVYVPTVDLTTAAPWTGVGGHPKSTEAATTGHDSEEDAAQPSSLYPSLLIPWAPLGSLASVLETRALLGAWRRHEGVSAVHVLLGVCRALRYLHARRVAHGDLHLGNILSLATGPIDVNDVALSDFSCAHVDPTGDLTTPMDLVLRQGHARLSTQEPLQACQILPLTKDAPHVSCRSCVEANTQWTRVLNATLRATSIGDVETAACTARLASLADSATAATGGHVWICAPEVLRARVAAHSIHPSDPPSNYPTTTMAATCKGRIHRSRQQGVVSVPVKSANVVAGPATAASMNWLSADIFSLGIVVWQLLAGRGRAPYPQHTEGGVAAAVIRGQRPNLNKRRIRAALCVLYPVLAVASDAHPPVCTLCKVHPLVSNTALPASISSTADHVTSHVVSLIRSCLEADPTLRLTAATVCAWAEAFCELVTGACPRTDNKRPNACLATRVLGKSAGDKEG